MGSSDWIVNQRNAVPGAYRGVAVSRVPAGMDEADLIDHFRGREAYLRTRFIVARSDSDRTALLQVSKKDSTSLFAPIFDVKVLSGFNETAYVLNPGTDTGVPSCLADVALQHHGMKAVVVEGKYAHVNFILNSDPIRLRVLDVVPPQPAKLVDQVRRVLDAAEDLAPIVIEPEVTDIHDLASENPAPDYLLPCRGSGIKIPGSQVHFLDERPEPRDWVMLGCERSRDIHQWFYGQTAPSVDTCPRNRSSDGATRLSKCCLLEADIDVGSDGAVVPWGASLDQIKDALTAIARTREPQWSTV